jgi:hypothetical protein
MLGINNKHIACNKSIDFDLPIGHQIGNGDFVFNQKPDLIFPHVISPEDQLQQKNISEALFYAYAKSGYVTEREMLSKDDFSNYYAFSTIELKNKKFGHFNVFIKKELLS